MTKEEREVMRMALEALEDLGMKHFESTGEVLYKETFTAIKEALAQPEHDKTDVRCECCGYMTYHREHLGCIRAAKLKEPEHEPMVWMYQDKSTHEVRFQKHMRDFVDHSKTSEVPLYSEPLANHELQCVCGVVWCGDEMVHLPNKAPPQRKPLTDEQKVALCKQFPDHLTFNAIYAIEAAHGIKGEA